MPAPCNDCPVEFPDSSGTPLACPGATTREHDPVWEKTTTSVPLNPILADQVWARGIQQGGHISLGLDLLIVDNLLLRDYGSGKIISSCWAH